MAILERFTDIVKANVNDLLDKCENPAKMIDQYLRDMTQDLAEVKKETAAVMAEETRAKRLLDDNAAEIKRYEDLARKALTAGNEGDARVFLGKKQQLEEKAASLQATYDAAHANAQKMRQMHDKLVSAFDRMERKADQMLDQANAMSELNAAPVDDAAALEAKYASAAGDAAVDDALAKLKAEMGL